MSGTIYTGWLCIVDIEYFWFRPIIHYSHGYPIDVSSLTESCSKKSHCNILPTKYPKKSLLNRMFCRKLPWTSPSYSLYSNPKAKRAALIFKISCGNEMLLFLIIDSWHSTGNRSNAIFDKKIRRVLIRQNRFLEENSIIWGGKFFVWMKEDDWKNNTQTNIVHLQISNPILQRLIFCIYSSSEKSKMFPSNSDIESTKVWVTWP